MVQLVPSVSAGSTVDSVEILGAFALPQVQWERDGTAIC